MEIIRETSRSELFCDTRHFIGGYSPFHWHEKIEICQVFSPGCSFFIDGEIIKTKPGDIVVMGEYAVHKFIIETPGSVARLCQFPVDILLNSGAEIKPLKKHITKEEIASHEGLGKKIDSILDVMEQEEKARTVAENPCLRNLSASLYFLLMRYFAADNGEPRLKSDRHEFYKIADFINNNYTKDINVDYISRELCIPRGKLSAVFKKYTQSDVSSYINSLRVNRANQLFENGHSITEAAFECNIYKKVMGITPSEYIKSK